MMRFLKLFPSFMFLLVVYFSFALANSSSSLRQLCLFDESRALLQFRQLFSFDLSASPPWCYRKYAKMVSWKEGTDCCEWDGIACDAVTGHVIGLDLSCSLLHGTIYSHKCSLCHLSHLQSLNLAFNDFNNSQIPPCFGSFSSLIHLNLSSSRFSGEIPPQLTHLSKLESLDLSFSGNDNLHSASSLERLIHNFTQLRDLDLGGVSINSIIPKSLMNLSALNYLNLQSCGLKSKFPIDIFHLPNLQHLDLTDNPELIGKLPEFFNDSSPLRGLYLFFTGFYGEIPNSIGQLKSLETLGLGVANFSGCIPESLGNNSKLSVLLLAYNHFGSELPLSLWRIETLTDFDLSSNTLEGQIPDNFSTLGVLSVLDFSDNSFTGQFPHSIGNLARLAFLDLSDNKFSGSLPSQVHGLSNLAFLDIRNTFLTGTFPSWPLTLPSLEELWLDRNQLTGRISQLHTSSKLSIISLSNNNLCGLIPNSIFNLWDLVEFDLSSNNLSGIIKLDSFSTSSKLSRISLSNNNLHGPIPISIFSRQDIHELDLSSNNLSGIIKPEDGFFTSSFQLFPTGNTWPSLEFLELNSNELQGSLGSLPIPSEGIKYYSVANNQLTGEISLCFCNKWYLEFLDLSNNNLRGAIPPCLSNFNSLQVLNLQHNALDGAIPRIYNQLQGQLPRSLAHCKLLQLLNLGNNMLVDTFPLWLATLPKLQVLVLRHNRLHGSLWNPCSNVSFAKLDIIDVSDNNFTGTLPSYYFKSWHSMMVNDENRSNWKSLTIFSGVFYFYTVTLIDKGLEMERVKILNTFKAVDLSNNNFQGEIPKSIGQLKALRALNFSNNHLTGSIPAELANLKDLESLDLARNNLSGIIPPKLASLTFLEVLDLSHNHLEGSIPRSCQFDTFPNTSYLGNPGLCGFPLSKPCGEAEVTPQPSSDLNQTQNSQSIIYDFDWKVVTIGYGCGMVVGVIMGNYIYNWKQEAIARFFRIRLDRQGKGSCKRRRGKEISVESERHSCNKIERSIGLLILKVQTLKGCRWDRTYVVIYWNGSPSALRSNLGKHRLNLYAITDLYCLKWRHKHAQILALQKKENSMQNYLDQDLENLTNKLKTMKLQTKDKPLSSIAAIKSSQTSL
ncbi:Leucine-rich repeat-containing N-terminal, plant-type [Dillenia turbinata]|uniref:Leucine-rich repeat-containing N-terminal, plant-type n=1 Tax=Dillenia turbinata TaxID=194707 RepID=A0AAN8VMQ7_9MAGN